MGKKTPKVLQRKAIRPSLPTPVGARTGRTSHKLAVVTIGLNAPHSLTSGKKSQLSIHVGLGLFSLSLALICYLCRRVERVDALLSAVDSCFWPQLSMHFVIVFIFMHAIELAVIFFLLLLGSLRPFCYFSTPSTQSEVS